MTQDLLRLSISITLAAMTVFGAADSTAAEPSLSPAPGGTFSIVVIPDTQGYRGRGTKAQPDSTDEVTNPVFDAYSAWISANAESQGIAFVSHVGDIVDKNVSDQWALARTFMDRFHGRIPYGISVGNHDMTGSGDSSLFQTVFPAARFSGFPWYGGAFEDTGTALAISGNNANSFQLFSAEGLDFVFVHLECNAPDSVLAWVDGVFEKHADRRGLVTTHMGLGPRDKPKGARDYFDAPKGRMRWKKRHGKRGNTPQQMWDKCFRKHKNLAFIFCGDQSRTQALRQISQGDHGNPVHELLSDYGSAGFRIYRFAPKKNLVHVFTYNPRSDGLCSGTRVVPDRDQHQFTLEYGMQ
jgi:hypothetical protein